MKKTIILLTILLLVPLVFAQDLDIKLIQYDTKTDIARIQIANLGKTPYTNIQFSVDNEVPKLIVGRINPMVAVIKTLPIVSGKHTIIITTNEATFSRQLEFAKSVKEVEEEKQKQKEQKDENLHRGMLL